MNIENFIQKNEYDSKIYNTLYKIYGALGETKKANNPPIIIPGKTVGKVI